MKKIFYVAYLFGLTNLAFANPESEREKLLDQTILVKDELEFFQEFEFKNESKHEAADVVAHGKLVRTQSGWMKCQLEKRVEPRTTLRLKPGRKLKVTYFYDPKSLYQWRSIHPGAYGLEGHVTLTCFSHWSKNFAFASSVITNFADVEKSLSLKLHRAAPLSAIEDEI
jgi:hypothetical protein